MPGTDTIDLVRQLYRDGLIAHDDLGQAQVETNRLSRAMLAHLATNGMLVDGGGPSPEMREAMRFVVAEGAIRRLWEDEGGPGSSLGLATAGPALMVAGAGGEYAAAFRSGAITVKGTEVCSLTERVLVVEFVGLECVVRQEKTDELYGVVALLGPANRALATRAFPGGDNTLDMGPDGQRLWATNIRLYEGPVEDVTLVASLIEHDDFADVGGASRRIADVVVEKGGALLGGLTGVPAEAVAENTWFRDGLASGIGLVLGDLLGAGDDPYPSQALRVPWGEIGEFGPPRQPPVTRGDDPRQIPRWTHKVKLSGHDDGGDYGEYHCYFDLWVEEVTRKRCRPV